MSITKKTEIGELIEDNPEAARFFVKVPLHMHLLSETIEQICTKYNMNVDETVKKINDLIGD